MKFQIITIGKKHDKFLEDAILDFEKRIKSNFDVEWSILESVDNANKEIQKQKEGEKIISILDKTGKDSFIILLDESGKEKSTKGLAQVFEEKMNQGVGKIIFIIGGAFGVSREVFEKSDLVLSLSKLTFPHMLVRLILIEQIYRSISILNNSKYHHE